MVISENESSLAASPALDFQDTLQTTTNTPQRFPHKNTHNIQQHLHCFQSPRQCLYQHDSLFYDRIAPQKANMHYKSSPGLLARKVPAHYIPSPFHQPHRNPQSHPPLYQTALSNRVDQVGETLKYQTCSLETKRKLNFPPRFSYEPSSTLGPQPSADLHLSEHDFLEQNQNPREKVCYCCCCEFAERNNRAYHSHRLQHRHTSLPYRACNDHTQLIPSSQPTNYKNHHIVDRNLTKEVREIKKMLKGFMVKVKDKDDTDLMAQEWRLVALVLDRLLFFIYLVIIFVSMAATFPWREALNDDETSLGDDFFEDAANIP